MSPRPPERLAALRTARARCLLAVRRLRRRALKGYWTDARLRAELRRARMTVLAHGASNKQWYAAVRRIFRTGARGASLVDPRQLGLPFGEGP